MDRWYDDQDQTPRGPVFPPPDLAGDALKPTPPGEWRNLPEAPAGPPTLDQAMRRAAVNVLTGASSALLPKPRDTSGDEEDAAKPVVDRSGVLGAVAAATAAPNQWSKGVQGQALAGAPTVSAALDRWMDEVRHHYATIAAENPDLDTVTAVSNALERARGAYERRFEKPLTEADPLGGHVAGPIIAAADVATNPLVMKAPLGVYGRGAMGAGALGGEVYNAAVQEDDPEKVVKNDVTGAGAGTALYGLSHVVQDLHEHAPEAARAVRDALMNNPALARSILGVRPDLGHVAGGTASAASGAVTGTPDMSGVASHPGLLKTVASVGPYVTDAGHRVAHVVNPLTQAGAERWSTHADAVTHLPHTVESLVSRVLPGQGGGGSGEPGFTAPASEAPQPPVGAAEAQGLAALLARLPQEDQDRVARILAGQE